MLSWCAQVKLFLHEWELPGVETGHSHNMEMLEALLCAMIDADSITSQEVGNFSAAQCCWSTKPESKQCTRSRRTKHEKTWTFS